VNLVNHTPVQQKSKSGKLVFYIPKSLLEVKELIIEKITHDSLPKNSSEVIPYTQLKIKNTSEVYKVSKSFISDLETGKKSFGLLSLKIDSNDLSLLAIASCLSYTQNNCSVLLVVKDLSSAQWTKYNSQFAEGRLGDLKTKEWGNLCLLDYRELLNSSKNKQVDFKFIYSEFDAVFWSLPEESKINNLKEVYLDILRSLDSISISLKPGQISVKDIMKVEQYYNSLGIPLKGILHEGGTP
jgi:hypothetical protein